jgi:hypothetical protein
MAGEDARLSPDTVALLGVGLAVIVANLPSLLGFFHPNPLDFRGGLSQTVTPGLLAGRPTIDPSNGYDSQAIGHLAALDLLHLHLPWWNPYEATGMPLLGETQAAALFPPTLLLALSNGQLDEHVLLELLAGICTYRLLRRVGVTRAAGIAGGVAFALNGKFAWFGDATVNPLPFLPMLLLGIERAFDASRTSRRGGWRLIALAGALTAYAGFPEVAYADVLLVVVWAGWRCGCLPGSDRRRFVVKLGAGSVVGTLLAAPMLLAMFDYLSHADLASHVGSQLGSRHLPLSDVAQMLLPYLYGPVNGGHHAGIWVMVGGYLSTVLVLLAALGLITPGRRGLKLVLVAWELLVFAHMYGAPVVVRDVLGVLPEIARIQFYRYATAALELPVIVLAALGLDDLTRVCAHRRRLIGCAVLALAAVAGAGLVARPVIASFNTPVRHGETFFTASIAWAVLSATAVGVTALVRRTRLRAGLLVLVVVVDAVLLFAAPEFSAPRATRVDLSPVTYLRRHLGQSRFYTLGPIQPNYGSYFRLASLRVDDFPPDSYVRYVHSHLNPFENFVGYQPPGVPTARQELLHHLTGYRFAGVRYVLTRARHGFPARDRAFRLVFHSPTTRIYRLTRAAPYFGAAGCRVTSAQVDSVRLLCRRPTTLVRRETWFAGWSAQIDGRATSIRRFHGVFQQLRVPAGADRVSFEFVPVGMDWALRGLLAGCALMLVPSAWGLAAQARMS